MSLGLARPRHTDRAGFRDPGSVTFAARITPRLLALIVEFDERSPSIAETSFLYAVDVSPPSRPRTCAVPPCAMGRVLR